MKKFSNYVGLDMHKETIAVAEAEGGEVRYHGEIANTPIAIDKLIKQLRKAMRCYRFATRRDLVVTAYIGN